MAVEYRKERGKWGYRVMVNGTRYKRYTWNSRQEAELALLDFWKNALPLKATQNQIERSIQASLVVALSGQGLKVETEVELHPYGRCDLAIRGHKNSIIHIIEIKTRDYVQGLRQLKLYQVAKPHAQLVLVMPHDLMNPKTYLKVKAAGVDLWVWGPGNQLRGPVPAQVAPKRTQMPNLLAAQNEIPQ